MSRAPLPAGVVVVDEVAGVGRADHVVVHVEVDAVLVGRRQRATCSGCEPSRPCSSAPHQREAQVVARGVAAGGPGERGLEDRGGAGAVVVDAGAGRDAVEVGAGHHDVLGVAARPVGDEVVRRPRRGRERLDLGGVADGVELGLHPVERGLVARSAGGAVAAVGGGDVLQLLQVGGHVGDAEVGRGRGDGGRGGAGEGRGDEGAGGDGGQRGRTKGTHGDLPRGRVRSTGRNGRRGGAAALPRPVRAR